MTRWKKIAEEMMNAMLKVWLKLPIWVLAKVSPKHSCILFTRAVGESMEEALPYFVSYQFRPKKADDFLSREEKSPNADKFAIIMQGPLVRKNDFTLETVRLYEKLFPGVLIIVSTWDTEEKEYVMKLREEKNCTVLLNQMPCHGGFLNINYQTRSTVAGIRYAQEQGKKFVFKTRCDYRFAKRGLLEYLHQLLLAYPCGGTLTHQRYRIVMTSGRRGDMFRPFFVGDQFNFGYSEDMLNLWDQPMIEQECTMDEFARIRKQKHLSWKQEREYTSILIKRFVQKMSGEELEISVKNYWDFVQKYLILVSAKDVDAYYYKYAERYEESKFCGDFYRQDSLNTCYAYNWNFVSWSNLYHGMLKYDEEMEKISEQNFF